MRAWAWACTRASVQHELHACVGCLLSCSISLRWQGRCRLVRAPAGAAVRAGGGGRAQAAHWAAPSEHVVERNGLHERPQRVRIIVRWWAVP